MQDLAKAFANFGAVTAVRVSQRKGQRAAQAWIELDTGAAASRACRSSTTVVRPLSAPCKLYDGLSKLACAQTSCRVASPCLFRG